MITKPSGMQNSRIYVVGTIHNDPEGDERLNFVFEKLNPSVIGVELPEEVCLEGIVSGTVFSEVHDTMRNYWAKLFRLADIDATSEELDTLKLNPFELKSALNYVGKNPSTKILKMDIMPDFGYNELMEVTFKTMLVPYETFLVDSDKRADKRKLLLSLKDPKFRLNQDRLASDRGYDVFDSVMQDSDANRKEALEKVMELCEEYYPEGKKVWQYILSPSRDEHMANKIREAYDSSGNVVAVVGNAHVPGLSNHLSDLNPVIISLRDYVLENGFK